MRPLRFLAILLVSVVLASVVGFLAAAYGLTPEQLTAFLGTLIGSMITVGGAIFVIEWQRFNERRRSRALLVDLLADVLAAAERVEAPPDDDSGPPAIRQQIALTELRSAMEHAITALQWLKPDSSRMVRAFGIIKRLTLPDAMIERARDRAADPTALANLSLPMHILTARAAAAMELLRED